MAGGKEGEYHMALFKKKKADVSMEEAMYMETLALLIWRIFK